MPELTSQQLFDLALQHHNAGRLQEAENLYRKLLAQHPNHASALNSLGLLALGAGRNEMAVDLFRRAISLMPTSPEAH
jgi:protein O-GlcNAc transferase